MYFLSQSRYHDNARYTMAKRTHALRIYMLHNRARQQMKHITSRIRGDLMASTIVLLTAYPLRNTRDISLRSTDHGRPLLAFRSTIPALSIFRERSFTKLTNHFFRRHSEQICLATHLLLLKNITRTFFLRM